MISSTKYELPPLEELIRYSSVGDDTYKREYEIVGRVLLDLFSQADDTYNLINAELLNYARYERNLRSGASAATASVSYKGLMADSKRIIESAIGNYIVWVSGFNCALYTCLSPKHCSEGMSEENEFLIEAVYTFQDAFSYYYDKLLPKMNESLEELP